MKNIFTLFLIAVSFVSCSSDNSSPEINKDDTVADHYGAYIKSIKEVEGIYRFYGPAIYDTMQGGDNYGQFEKGGKYFKIYKEGVIAINGEEIISFPITKIEKNDLHIDHNDSYETMHFELRIASENKNDVEVFTFSSANNKYLVDNNNRNKDAESVFEENKTLWFSELRYESLYYDEGYSGNIYLKVRSVNQEWIDKY